MKNCSQQLEGYHVYGLSTNSKTVVQFSKGLKEGHCAGKRWNYFNHSSSYVRHKDSILQTAYSVDLRKGAGFTSSIISSFFSSAHQYFNSCGSGIKGLNLSIYDVNEDNDVAIMTQPLDFTASDEFRKSCLTFEFARSQSYNPPALPDAAKYADRLHTQRDSILETPSHVLIKKMKKM